MFLSAAAHRDSSREDEMNMIEVADDAPIPDPPLASVDIDGAGRDDDDMPKVDDADGTHYFEMNEEWKTNVAFDRWKADTEKAGGYEVVIIYVQSVTEKGTTTGTNI
jgi:hypothetical protein